VPLRAGPTREQDAFGMDTATTQSAGSGRVRDADDALVLGAQFRGYRVTHRIGSGGMGTVYAAEYVSSLHTETALRAVVKILKPALAQQQAIVDRFIQEAQIAARIKNDGIAKVIAVDRHESGHLYILMEMFDGESLGARLRREQRLDLEQAVSIVWQCSVVLQAAHQVHVVHRDLKPDNVFLVEDATVSRGEKVKILDFGIAKLVMAAPATGDRAGRAVLGTPAYMSPEQCMNPETVDHRTDLYALGCIFFQMLCGRLPFVPLLPADWREQVMNAHLHEPPPSLGSLVPGIPPEIDAMIARLLCKDPAERYQSAADLIAALDELYPDAAHDGAGLPAGRMSGTQAIVAPELAAALRAAEQARPAGPRRRTRVLAGLLAMLAGGVLAWLWPLPAPSTLATPATRAPLEQCHAVHDAATCTRCGEIYEASAPPARELAAACYRLAGDRHAAAGVTAGAIGAYARACAQGDGRACRVRAVACRRMRAVQPGVCRDP
jgi:eukaryotic-like serine/threonine-protein kinase